jgi:hypothetical protein
MMRIIIDACTGLMLVPVLIGVAIFLRLVLKDLFRRPFS